MDLQGDAPEITAVCPNSFVQYCSSSVLPFLQYAFFIPGGNDDAVEMLQRGAVVIKDGI